MATKLFQDLVNAAASKQSAPAVPNAEERLLNAYTETLLNPRFPDQPDPRDYAAELRDSLQVQIDMAPEMYGVESMWRPAYAQLETDIMKQQLGGNQGLLKFYEDTILPSSLKSAGLMRDADIADLERLGPRASEAILDANPQQKQLMGELNKQAMADLNLGGKLSPDEIRELTQATRAGYNDRGMVRSGGAVLDEIANRSAYKQQRQGQRQTFAGQVAGLNKAVTGDPMMAVLGRPSESASSAAGMMSFGSNAANAGTSGMFDPQSAYAGNLYAGNQASENNAYSTNAGLMGTYMQGGIGLHGNLLDARTATDISRRERDASVTGGVLGLAGGALGGLGSLLCWVAREVYGADGPEWRKFRLYLFAGAPVWFFKLYAAHGQRFAEWLKNKPIFKRVIRKLMDTKVMEVRYG